MDERIKEVTIKSITIKLGDREIELTIKEAKDLSDVLSDLFGKEKIVERIVDKEDFTFPIYPFNPQITYLDDDGKKFVQKEFPDSNFKFYCSGDKGRLICG